MRRGIIVFAAALVAALPGLLHAQTTAQVVRDFATAHPGVRISGAQFNVHEGEGDEALTSTMVYGVPMSTGASALESSQSLINQLRGAMGTNVGQLVPKVQANGTTSQPIYMGAGAVAPKFNVVRFDQQIGGIPVFRSGVGVVVRNEAGNPSVLSTFDVKELDGFQPGIIAGATATVTDAMRESVTEMFDSEPVLRSVLRARNNMRTRITGDAEFVVFAGFQTTQEPELAVQFEATRGTIRTFPDYQKQMVIASVATGEILFSESLVHTLDVTGSVIGRATDGLAASECDPEALFGMPYARVNITGGATTFADIDGNFTVPANGNGQVTVNSTLSGQFFEVRDQAAGNSIPTISQTTSANGSTNFTHNPSGNNADITSNVNCYLESNVVRDYVLSFEPNFPTINNQTGFDVNTNIDSNCNAFYDGSSINFFQGGGGCNNTGFADVVYHEYGHHLVQVTGNGQGQMGEGGSDCVGILIQDEPQLGAGFNAGNCNTGIRTGANSVQYPCNGGIHACGQLISGCVWDMRQQLSITEPSSFRDINASLFFGMLIMRGQMEPGSQTISPDITIYYITLDDDDGTIGNGSPHFSEIDTAFSRHNMDPPPLDSVVIAFPNGTPDLVPDNGGVGFEVTISDISDSHIPSTAMLNLNTGSGFQAIPLVQTSAGNFNAEFPPTTCGQMVEFFVSVQTSGGGSMTAPTGAPGQGTFLARSGAALVPIFVDNFQTNTGWTISGNVADGQWQRAVPAGGGDRGDPADDGDGSGFCYVTDNADGNSDVDGGTTILTSPVFNGLSNQGESYVSYYRWFSNDEGGGANDDRMIVEISNNGGNTWNILEIIGPTGPDVSGGWVRQSFLLTDVIVPTSNMRVRFMAEDINSGSIVEAGVDGFDVDVVTCGTQVDDLVPSSFTIDAGNQFGGTVADLAASDNSDVGVSRNPISVSSNSTIRLGVNAPSSTPQSMIFTIEESALGRGNITRITELFNYNTNSWEQIDGRQTSRQGDRIDELPVSGDVTRFVNGSGDMEARIRYSGATNRAGYSVFIDHVFWTFEY